MHASMRGMYLISAADHTSVKHRRRRTAPPCASRPHTCAVDGDVAGDAYIKASAAAAGSDSEIASLAQALIT